MTELAAAPKLDKLAAGDHAEGMSYLETLPRQGYWVDWWGRQQIEDRLRRLPHVTARFGDLVKLQSK